jgi:hypothetical protein
MAFILFIQRSKGNTTTNKSNVIFGKRALIGKKNRSLFLPRTASPSAHITLYFFFFPSCRCLSPSKSRPTNKQTKKNTKMDPTTLAKTLALFADDANKQRKKVGLARPKQ